MAVQSFAAGLVRPARRPPGWCAPGPTPPVPSDPELWPGADEDVCHLAGNWRILQLVHGHRWSLDDLVTAWVAADQVGPRPSGTFVDLGTGIGAVLMLLAWRFPEMHGIGIEAQRRSVALARRSLEWNGAADRCRIVHADFRRWEPAVREQVSLVTGTPPYLPEGTATPSLRPQCGPCRLERRGGIEAYCDAGARLLGGIGRLVMCAGARQDTRVIAAARASGLAIGRRVDVIPRAGKARLFSVWVLTAARAGSAVTDVVVIRDRAGRRTEACRAIRAVFGMPP